MTRACLGPRGTTAPVSFTLPAGACDAHAHVFGPFSRFPLFGERNYTPPEASAGMFIEHLDRLGFERGVLITATCQNNDALVNALLQHPDRLRGVVVLDHESSTADIARWHEAGVRAVRINLFNGDTEAELAAVESRRALLAQYGWHVQIWTQADTFHALAPRLFRLELPLVIDHMGRIAADRAPSSAGFEFLLHMLDEGRCWVKLSGADRNTTQGSPYTDTGSMMQALVHANPDQLVWGSDWPHIKYYRADEVPDDGMLLDLAGRCIPDASVREKIFSSNPRRLYGFSD